MLLKIQAPPHTHIQTEWLTCRSPIRSRCGQSASYPDAALDEDGEPAVHKGGGDTHF